MTDLAALVRRFQGVAVAVFGDPIIDYYHFGRATRLCPEAPVPVFVEDRLELRDGGAQNVTANLRALGMEVHTLYPPPPWTLKHRYLAGTQQLLRVDRDRDHFKSEAPVDLRVFDRVAALIVSDYAKGWVSQDRCRQVCGAAKGIPIVVDPKGHCWTKYPVGAVICPNQVEYQQIPHASTRPFSPLVEKRGPAGLRLHYEPELWVDYPSKARAVFDVTGAGDTVTAIIGATLAVQGTIEEACELANIAAGLVVAQVGTTPCSSEMLLAELGA